MQICFMTSEVNHQKLKIRKYLYGFQISSHVHVIGMAGCALLLYLILLCT